MDTATQDTMNKELRAIEVYRSGEVTLSRASEISDLDMESFKDHLAEKGVDRVVEGSRGEIIEGADRIRKYRG